MFLPKFFIPLALTVALSFEGCAQKTGDQLSIAFYNCENFFDTVHNPVKEDEEFTPGGKYHYTQKVYEQKLHNIATVLQSMGPDGGPALIGLAEVENNTVLTDLVNQPEIANRHYKYEWFDGPDPRGINVALLYNPALFRVIKATALHVDLGGTGGKTVTRDVLQVHGILKGDTIDVLVNHWPSRRGGEDASEQKRALAAKVNKDAIDQIMKNNPYAKVIVMGDLNDNPTDNSITDILGATGEQNQVLRSGMYDPWTAVYNSGAGTEVYQHNWNLFDQIIVSCGLLKNPNHKLHYEKAAVFKPDLIIDHYKGHEGEPHRSFVGTHWINGYSDHFPVILYLGM